MRDIQKIYSNAVAWTEEMWALSQIWPTVERFRRDRALLINQKHDRIDYLWARQKAGIAGSDQVIRAILDWWGEITAALEDCAPLAGFARKGVRMARQAPETERWADSRQLELMPF